MHKKGKCDHIIGYHPGEWDDIGLMVCESNKDDKWIFRDGMFEPFNFCPNCGLPVGDNCIEELEIAHDKALFVMQEENKKLILRTREQAEIALDREIKITMLEDRSDSQELMLKYLNSQSWWQRLFERTKNDKNW